MKKFSIKSFPWAPGIPWKVRRGKYVVPELPAELVNQILSNKDIVVCAFGGLLESFYSLSILETMNRNLFGKNKYWSGNPEYYSLIAANELSKPFNEVSKDDMRRFPTPIFLDKNNRVYFNCLNNYLEKRAYYSNRGYPDNRAAIQQIVEKSTLQWDERNIPQIRYPEIFGNHKTLFKSRNISFSKKSILLLPDETGHSMHGVSCLNWNEHQVKSFIAMASHLEYQVFLLTKHPESYWGTLAKVIPFSINMFFTLIGNMQFIISKEIDFLLISLGISDAAIISNNTEGAFKFSKNSSIVRSESVIYTSDNFLPSDAFEILRRSNDSNPDDGDL